MEQKVPENIKNIRFEDAVRSVFGVAVWEFKSEVELKAKLLRFLMRHFLNFAKPSARSQLNTLV